MKEKLQKELIDAMKAHDKKKIDVIKLVKAAVQNEEINLKKELSDDEVLSIITKQVKMRKDAILEFEKASRNDLIESYNEEIDILSEYLPKSLTDEEAIKIIEDAFSVVNPQAISDMGKIMKEVSPKLKNRFDMGKASKIIKDKLSQI
ncbi:MAG: GatB/YqeY domain-containing protein [Bacilli bacterium]|nr:GatB/YqeY domain-containing protein [Bacilli bacterium]